MRSCALSRAQEGQTPLHIAASWEKFELVSLLVEEGADKEAKDNVRPTPNLSRTSSSSFRASVRSAADAAPLHVRAPLPPCCCVAQTQAGATPLQLTTDEAICALLR